MLLAIDIGNSNIVLGVYVAEHWQHIWRIETSTQKPETAYALELSDLFLENAVAPNINEVILSSVVPTLTPVWESVLSSFFGKAPILLNSEAIRELGIAERPHEIGSDLVANAVAGYDLFQKSCVVVDFGTALTFTVVNQEGKILGVAIAPGLKTALYSLFKSTAQLPEVPLMIPDSAIGTDTAHALQAGVLIGYVGLVKHLLSKIQEELNENCFTVATGGLSEVIPAFREVFDRICPTLTLDGLRILSKRLG
jgi:type III pantothenate kinase